MLHVWTLFFFIFPCLFPGDFYCTHLHSLLLAVPPCMFTSAGGVCLSVSLGDWLDFPSIHQANRMPPSSPF
ncbi:hypothetical protein DPEC_G00149250 [Dallia pectoralis]|uniref:Uncharacterized protein n=1 Tax=Dallia pectoralis TaxID=75939 RepID=A0ACC2GII6_DALPE|nr:hypothetical protein DPEC_G00149250 [Dallia pectoralis]